MRSINKSKFKEIADTIKKYMIQLGRTPSQRELAEAVNMTKSSVANYIKAMQKNGMIEGNGRHIVTEDIKLIAVPIVDSLQNNLHVYDKANISDYIFISRKPYGDGEFGIVRAIDNSMLGANIRINNQVMVRRQKHAIYGQIVLVKVDDQYYLRRYFFDERSQCPKLKTEYADGTFDVIDNFEIRGVAVNIIARLD